MSRMEDTRMQSIAVLLYGPAFFMTALAGHRREFTRVGAANAMQSAVGEPDHKLKERTSECSKRCSIPRSLGAYDDPQKRIVSVQLQRRYRQIELR